jgi:DNA-binding NtrC family response regulator
MAALCGYDWPGNIRELRNTIERALILEDGDLMLPQQVLGLTIAPRAEAASTFVMPPAGISLEQVEESFVRQAMALASGNQSRAARLLGIGRDALRYKLKKFHISDEDEDATTGE